MYRRFGIALVVAAVAAACNVIDPSKNTVETFKGTIQPGSVGDTHTFRVANTGEVVIKVTLTPSTLGTPVGILLGQLVSNQCSGVPRTATVGVTIDVPITSGTWCVVIYDPGTFTVAETYEVEVRHP